MSHINDNKALWDIDMKTVEAVKTDEQRQHIEAHLSELNPVYLDIWKFGVNTALRISDLLSIRMDQVSDLDPDKPVLKLKEAKTGKGRCIRLNSVALAVINDRLEKHPKAVYLFQSDSPRKKRDPQPVTRRQVSRVFEKVGQSIRPRVDLGTHSMRKTRGYAMHAAGISIEKIAKVLNHDSPATTMVYIGITQEDIDNSYTEFVL